MVCLNFRTGDHELMDIAGMTETSTVVLSTSAEDIWFGSCGSILPAVEVKIVSIEGAEITDYNQPGELMVKSPSATLGYLNNDEATREAFQDGWVRTGDEAVVRVGPNGNEHVFIVDRIKELIKVKVFIPTSYLCCQGADIASGLASCTCRARGTSSEPPCGCRCMCHSCAR